MLGNYAIAGGLVALCSRFRLPGRIGGQVAEWSGCGGLDRVAGWSGARRDEGGLPVGVWHKPSRKAGVVWE